MGLHAVAVVDDDGVARHLLRSCRSILEADSTDSSGTTICGVQTAVAGGRGISVRSAAERVCQLMSAESDQLRFGAKEDRVDEMLKMRKIAAGKTVAGGSPFL